VWSNRFDLASSAEIQASIVGREKVAEFGRIWLSLARGIGSTRARCTTPVDDAADKKRQKGRQKPKVVLDLFPVL
jgi:hypothetical protein